MSSLTLTRYLNRSNIPGIESQGVFMKMVVIAQHI
jgi:hypothetical protein